MEGNNPKAFSGYLATGSCAFEPDTQELKRPIFLGDLIIGYETVSPKKPKTESKTKQRIVQRKERERSSEIDLTPIVMPDTSVLVYDEETGMKRRINLREIAEIEKGSEPGATRDAFLKEDFEDKPDKGDTRAGKLFVDRRSDYEAVINKGKSDKTDDKQDNETTKDVAMDIPIRKDNPFLLEDIATSGLSKCETQSTTDCKSFEDRDDDLVSKNHSVLPELSQEQEATMTPEDPVLTDLDEGNNEVAIGDAGVLIEIQEFIPPRNPKDFCNICGNRVGSRKDAKTYLEVVENSLQYYVCLTCCKKVSFSELTRHKASCFLSQDEFYYHGCEFDFSREVKFRMVACESCVDDVCKT